MTTTAQWVFEGPDPEVGIFGDLIVHTCSANVDEEQAKETDVTMRTLATPGLIEITRTFQCSACGATTTTRDQEPA